MAISIVVPQLGESIAEGTVSKWLKAEGDMVQEDEPIVEIMTDKVTVEVPSPGAGVLTKLLVPEGTTVPVGEEIARIGDVGEVDAEPPASQESAPSAASDAVARTPATPVAAATPPPVPAPAAMAEPVTATVVTAPPPAAMPSPASSGGKRPYLSPVVRRLAREHGVDATHVTGTGRGGRVTRDDMLAFIEGMKNGQITAVMPTSLGPPEEVVPIVGIRKVIADRMVKSKFTATHVTALEEVDVSALIRIRRDYKETIFLETQGVRLTFTPFFVKAAVIALKEFPTMNATWQGDEAVVIKRYHNIGVAVGRDAGLIVPVVKNAGEKNLVAIARDINDLSKRAHENRLTPDELQGGTFSVTNAGRYGSFATTPIINYPEVAILGVHKIADRPAVVDGQLAIRPMTNIAISFDHRWIDGHIAVQFIARVKEILEKPELLWLSV